MVTSGAVDLSPSCACLKELQIRMKRRRATAAAPVTCSWVYSKSWENHHCEKHGNTQISPNLSHSYERGWPLACLEDLINPNQASHQCARWTSSVSMLKVPVLAIIIEISAVWPWYRRTFQDICRGLDNYSRAYLWLISHDLSHGVPPHDNGVLYYCSIGPMPSSPRPE
jgi:hypothetical protein